MGIELEGGIAHAAEAVETELAAAETAGDVALQSEGRQAVGNEEYGAGVLVGAWRDGSARHSFSEHGVGHGDEAVEQVCPGNRVVGEEASQIDKPGLEGRQIGVPLAHCRAHVSFAHSDFAVGDLGDDEIVARGFELAHASKVVDDKASTHSGFSGDGAGACGGKPVLTDEPNCGVADASLSGGIIRS